MPRARAAKTHTAAAPAASPAAAAPPPTAAALKDVVVLFDSRALLPAARRATHEFVDFLGQAAGIALALHDLSCDGPVDPSAGTATYLAVGHTAAVAVGVSASKHLSGLGSEGIVISAALAPPHVVVTGGVEHVPGSGNAARAAGAPCVSDPTTAAATITAPTTSEVVGERGTMYALYQFLHLAGFRWYAHDCTAVPIGITGATPLSSLLVPSAADWPIDFRFVPPFQSRDLGYHCAFLSPDWARRNFVNGACCGPRVPAQEKAYDRFTVPWADEQLYGGHLRFSRWPGFEHTLPTMVPAASFFGSHPEWWGLDPKTGQRSADLQMCFSNTALQAFVATKVELAIDLDAAYGPQGLDARSKLPDAVAVVQGDGNGFCQCGPCTEIYKEEGGAISGAVVRFVNGVAAQVAKDRPEYAGVRIDTLAYEETLPPPKTAPRSNVTIRVCPIDADFNVPFTDKLNKAQAQAFQGWAELCASTGAQLWVYTYNTDFSHYLLPYPDVAAACANVGFFRSLGLLGVFEEGPYMSPGGNFAELKAWVLAQLLWAAPAAAGSCRAAPGTLPPPAVVAAAKRGADLVAEFLGAYYGPSAGPLVAQFLAALEKSAADAGRRMGLNPEPDAAYLSPAFVLQAEATLDEAVAKAEAGAEATPATTDNMPTAATCTTATTRFGARCRLLRLGVWYVMLLRFDELRAFAAAQTPPLPWQWGAAATGSLFAAFAHEYSAASVTHLNEDGHGLLWLRRKLSTKTAAAAAAAPAEALSQGPRDSGGNGAHGTASAVVRRRLHLKVHWSGDSTDGTVSATASSSASDLASGRPAGSAARHLRRVMVELPEPVPHSAVLQTAAAWRAVLAQLVQLYGGARPPAAVEMCIPGDAPVPTSWAWARSGSARHVETTRTAAGHVVAVRVVRDPTLPHFAKTAAAAAPCPTLHLRWRASP